MTPETDLHYTLIQYFESVDKKEISNILKYSKIFYEKQWDFTRIINNQRKLEINVKTPLIYKKILENYIDELKKIIFEVYEDDDDYKATDVTISILASKVTTIEIDEIEKEIVENTVYQNFVKEIIEMNLDKVEKDYLFEACECAMRNNVLSATTMLGCAAEYLLINMTKAYFEYLKIKGTPNECEGFDRKVINAKCAYNRLEEFMKQVNSKSNVFQSLGFENPSLNFNFLDIIRKTRNNSGHPTGTKISKEELQMTMGNYQHFIKLAHNAIKKLPELK